MILAALTLLFQLTPPWGLFTQTASSGTPDFTLPDASQLEGRVIMVKVLPTAAATLVRAPRNNQIDNADTYTVPVGGSAAFQSEAGNWRIVTSFAPPTPPSTTPLRVTSDVSNSTVNFSDVTGLTLAVQANTTYSFDCNLSYTSSVGTTAVQLSVNGPASPTAVRFMVTVATGFTNLIHTSSQNTYDTNQNPGSGGGPTALPAMVSGTLENGPNAGVLALRVRSEVALSAVVVQRGSFCIVTKY